MEISIKWLLVVFFTLVYLFLMIRAGRDSRHHALAVLIDVSLLTVIYLGGWILWLLIYYVL